MGTLENKDQAFPILVSEKRGKHAIIGLVFSEFGRDDLKQVQ